MAARIAPCRYGHPHSHVLLSIIFTSLSSLRQRRHRPVRGQRLKAPVALAVELENVRVEAPQRRPVRDGQQRDAGRLGRLVDGALHVNGHRTGALVQQRVLGPVLGKR